LKGGFMVRAIPSLELLRHEMRGRVCARCHGWPLFSESLGPEVVRPCELTCPVFVQLPGLRRIAALTDPMLRSPAEALRHRIDRTRRAGHSAAAADNPLRRYGKQIVRVILDVMDGG
jgi:hypothetical protein